MSEEASPPPTQDVGFEDLGLMHLYTTTTCRTIIGRIPELTSIWQNSVPEQAKVHPFLMHGLLSLAALHQINLRPETASIHLDRAVKHHNIALVKSKVPLRDLKEDNCAALFALSIVLTIFALALPVSPASPLLQDPIIQMTEIAFHAWGSRTIVDTGRIWIQRSPLSAFLKEDIWLDETPLLFDVQDSFTLLESEANNIDHPESIKAVYRDTIRCVKACLRLVGCSTEAGRSVEYRAFGLAWLTDMHTDFRSFLCRREPLALVVLSHFAVVLSALGDLWWCKGWGAALVKDIYDSVDETWRLKMGWPLSHINFRMEGAVS